MKLKIIVFSCLCTSFSFGQTLLERQAEKTREKIKQRAENRVEQQIDKGLDKAEEGIENSVKGEQKGKEKKQQTGSETIGTDEGVTSSPNVSSTPFKAYSMFDFVAGEKVIAYEDFSRDAIGDFPAKWNTNSRGEVVSLAPVEGHWMNIANSGICYPEFVNGLPENFTMEMDMVVSEDFSEMQSGLVLFFPELKSRNLQFDYHFSTCPQVGIDVHPHGQGGGSRIWVYDTSNEKVMSNESSLNTIWKTGQVNRISVWRQKTRLRVYVNERKVWDIPRAFQPTIVYSMLFGANIWEGKAYVSNLRWAEGAPDTRNKLVTEGKIVTRGILFDVNSDQIKPESYGALQDIAKTLNELPDVNVKIIGHTDADGDDKLNLELSKKRALAVKHILTKEFNISPDRMETDGKGESEPVDSNASPTGKANNRRVEFVKQ